VRLRYKFVLPINLILLSVLAASLASEWRRLERAEEAVLRARLDEEARFIRAAYRTFGVSDRFASFLGAFCHAVNTEVSPDHQVAVLNRDGSVVAAAAEHAPRPIGLPTLAALRDGFWLCDVAGEPHLIRVADQGNLRVVVAESLRALHARVRAALWSHTGWYVGSGLLLMAAVNVIIRRTVLRPIKELSRAARLLEQGQLGTQVQVTAEDEIGRLGRRFNAMSRALAVETETNRRDLEAARQVQSHLLPPPVFRLGCLEVAGVCIPKGPVGGDVYDVRPLPGDRVGVLIADVSGHNVAAALHTALVRAVVWREAELADSPGEVMARVNERLCHDLPDEHFASAFFGWFDPHSGSFCYANAGHPPAYLRSPRGEIHELTKSSTLLAIVSGVAYESTSVPVESGALLVIYTDGVMETRNPQGVFYGTSELIAKFRSDGPDSPAEALEGMLNRVASFRGGGPQEDDVTLMIARYDPAIVGTDAENAPSRASRLSLSPS
jgi:sigma-B regulation protein RsbU (phosphoserine phosphatase)